MSKLDKAIKKELITFGKNYKYIKDDMVLLEHYLEESLKRIAKVDLEASKAVSVM